MSSSRSSSSSPSFNSEIDVDWDAIFDPALTFPSPTSTNELTSPTTTNQHIFLPCPALSSENNVPEDQHATLKEFLRESTDQYIMALDYPSPSSPLHFESPQTPDSTPPTQPINRRRGPGRPSKAQLAREESEGKQTGKNMVTIRRYVHNDSAMRSRARLNTLLDELWDEVPEKERLTHPLRLLCRAEKIEIVRSYLRKLRKQSSCN